MKHSHSLSALVLVALFGLGVPNVSACAGTSDARAAIVAESSAVDSVLAMSPADGGPDDAQETLLLQQPTLSAEHIVFRYADDLWIVGRAGGDARRLTSSLGRESNPQLSPDGRTVAFSAQYEGNTDVYVISIDGGLPQRLTWHPDADAVVDWTADGKGVLFRSAREADTRTTRIFLVPLTGGMPTPYEMPKANHASLNDAGTHFAYTPTADAFGTWKRYRGGRISTVWIFDRATHEVEVVPSTGANDTFPCWLGRDVYFASDRGGVMDLFRFTPGTRQPQQITHFTDHDVRSLDAAHGAVVFEQAGALHIYEPGANQVTRLKIRALTDGLAAIPRWQKVEGHVRNAQISPNGKRAIFEARGEIITVPKEHGDARNLTQTPGVHERSPIWSPDGKQVAWLSDRGGEYHFVVQDQLGREEVKTYPLTGAGFYYSPKWSPDGKHILYVDKANILAYLTLESGQSTEVASVQGSLGVVDPDAVWSPDSKWIAFGNRNQRTLYDQIALFELATGTVTPVTDDFAASGSPAFSGDGKYLFFQASVNAGPALMGLNMTTSAARDTDSNLYVAVLQADAKSPLFPKSDDGVDEEKDEKDKDKDDKKDDDEKEDDGDEPADADGEKESAAESDGESAQDESGEKKDEKKEDQDALPALDLDGLAQRVLALPIASGNYYGLACSKDTLYFIELSRGGERALKSFDFDKKEAKSLKEGVRGFLISQDGKSLLLSQGSFSITDAKAADPKSIDINSVLVRVDPSEEWPQTLREVWRIERDYFYDTNMHGVDWDAMWTRWAAFLPHVKHRTDLTYLIRELIGELACGHEYVNGGESADPPQSIPVGLLGVDWSLENGRYRIERILSGQNWNPKQRAPLTEPGVDAKVGDYLIAVNGRPLDATQNIYQAFEYTADKQTDLTLASMADGSDGRKVTVVPVSNERTLRANSWIEDNRKRVDELSGGRLAYIYMPNTGGQGQNAFDRDYYSQLDKEGLVLDERYNGGGQVADYVVETLNRKLITLWRNREQWLGYSPNGVMQGPKVMVINEYAGSGGDWMPWAFKNQGVGKLVGTRTWGGLIGISNYPPLMDGGGVTAANFGVLDLEGNWIVENEGVAPDVEVIEWPKLILAGEDPQLDTAIRLALEELQRSPRKPEPTFRHPAPR